MTGVVRVHLAAWVLDDGAVPPFGVGERIQPDLGIAVEQLPLVATPDDSDGITLLRPPVEWSRLRARADVVGPARTVLAADGAPFSALVTPFADVPLVLIGSRLIDADWDGHRIVVRGDVVVEPYLWAEGGVFRSSTGPRRRAAVVDRIQTLTETAQLVNVTRTVPYRSDAADYLVDLRFDPL